MTLGAFVSPGRSLERTLERVELADRLGFSAIFTTHIASYDSLTVLMAYAARSRHARLGTGVLPIYSRTPVACAQQAVTVDAFSGGRLVLGLGVSHAPIVEGWYGQKIDRPVGDMRQYAGVVRAILRGEEPPPSDRFPTSFRFAGVDPRPEVPIYLAALSPRMLRLAGEIADGVVLWLCVPEYIASTVVPEIRAGAERAGRDPQSIAIVAAVPAAVTDDREAAAERLRNDLIPYFSLPFYRAMLERSGFGDELAAFDRALSDGGPAKAAAAISDRFVGALAAIGSAEEARAVVARYAQAGATLPCVGPIPGTEFTSTLEALAPNRR